MPGPTLDCFDVIVLGCGPAGGAAAHVAARLGLRTAVIDKHAFPRSKLCGGLFTGRARSTFREIFGEDLPQDLVLEKTALEFWMRGERIAELSGVPPMYLTMRLDLDAEIHRRAIAAGAADFTGQRVARLDLRGQRVELAGGQRLSYRILIGADGVNSQVARALWGASFDRRDTAFGLEVEAEAPEGNPARALRIDFSAARYGYGWTFPKRDSTTIGVAGIASRNDDMKAAMQAHLDRLGARAESGAVKGHFIPFGGYRKRPGRGEVVVCGDAAGLVDPITGEGIAYAMKSGQLAAEVARRCLDEGLPGEAARRLRAAYRPLHRSLWLANRLRTLIFHPALEPAFARAFRRSALLKQRYLLLLAGQSEYGEFFGAVLRRVPRFAVDVLRGALGRAR